MFLMEEKHFFVNLRFKSHKILQIIPPCDMLFRIQQRINISYKITQL